MTLPSQESMPLRTAGAVPLIGFGTWRLSGRSSYEAVLHALATGYRHIDTATMYGNEAEVGQAMRDSGLGRDEIFLTTKLLQDDADHPGQAIDASLRRLGTDYVDLWLIHWPPGGRASPKTWAQVLAQRERGKTRAAGVSNYSTDQVDELIAATGDSPTVNQVRWSPAIYDPAFARRMLRARGRPRGLQPPARDASGRPEPCRGGPAPRGEPGPGSPAVAHRAPRGSHP